MRDVLAAKRKLVEAGAHRESQSETSGKHLEDGIEPPAVALRVKSKAGAVFAPSALSI